MRIYTAIVELKEQISTEAGPRDSVTRIAVTVSADSPEQATDRATELVSDVHEDGVIQDIYLADETIAVIYT